MYQHQAQSFFATFLLPLSLPKSLAKIQHTVSPFGLLYTNHFFSFEKAFVFVKIKYRHFFTGQAAPDVPVGLSRREF